MKNSEKILKTLSSLIENGILNTNDIKKEISTDLKPHSFTNADDAPSFLTPTCTSTPESLRFKACALP